MHGYIYRTTEADTADAFRHLRNLHRTDFIKLDVAFTPYRIRNSLNGFLWI